jgi:hypothetical protein
MLKPGSTLKLFASWRLLWTSIRFKLLSGDFIWLFKRRIQRELAHLFNKKLKFSTKMQSPRAFFVAYFGLWESILTLIWSLKKARIVSINEPTLHCTLKNAIDRQLI